MSKKKTHEEFIEEVHKLVGNEYTVLTEYTGSDSRVRVKHNKCGHEYNVLPPNFLRGKRCPKCQHRSYKKTTKEFKDEILKVTNGSYIVIGEYINAATKILIKHYDCGYEYTVAPHDFLSGKRCPWCNQSQGEKNIREYLESNKIPYKIQYKIEKCKNIRPLPFDFAIFNDKNELLALIEFDGMQHFIDTGFANGPEKRKQLQKNEAIKNAFCLSNSIPLIRVPYTVKSIEEFLDIELDNKNIEVASYGL